MKVTIIQNGNILATGTRATFDDEGNILAEARLSTSDVKKLKRYACTLLIEDEETETTTELSSKLNAYVDDDSETSLRYFQLSFDGYPVEEPVEEEPVEEEVVEEKPKRRRRKKTEDSTED